MPSNIRQFYVSSSDGKFEKILMNWSEKDHDRKYSSMVDI